MSQGGAAAVHTSEADGRYTSSDILRNIFGLQSYESAKHVGEEKDEEHVDGEAIQSIHEMPGRENRTYTVVFLR